MKKEFTAILSENPVKYTQKKFHKSAVEVENKRVWCGIKLK